MAQRAEFECGVTSSAPPPVGTRAKRRAWLCAFCLAARSLGEEEEAEEDDEASPWGEGEEEDDAEEGRSPPQYEQA